jgi:hypothetical protein
MLINKIHGTINSLLKKNYTVEFWTDNNSTIILSFYHLNSVYNGLCYISKDSDWMHVDFQYHAKNKTVEKQLYNLCGNIKKLYKLNQLQRGIDVLESYKPLALEKYKELNNI